MSNSNSVSTVQDGTNAMVTAMGPPSQPQTQIVSASVMTDANMVSSGLQSNGCNKSIPKKADLFVTNDNGHGLAMTKMLKTSSSITVAQKSISRRQSDILGMQTTTKNESRGGAAIGIPVTDSESSLSSSLMGKRRRSVDSGLFCLGGGSSSRVSRSLSQTRHNHKRLKLTLKPSQQQPSHQRVCPMPMHSQNNELFYSDSDYTYPEASCSGNEHEHETEEDSTHLMMEELDHLNYSNGTCSHSPSTSSKIKMIVNSFLLVEASFQLQAHHHSLRIKQAKKERRQREDNEKQQQQEQMVAKTHEPSRRTVGDHDENHNNENDQFRHAMSHACHALRRYSEGTVATLDLTMMLREDTDGGDNANFCEERKCLLDLWHSVQMYIMVILLVVAAYYSC
jgi:hypothetical protein